MIQKQPASNPGDPSQCMSNDWPGMLSLRLAVTMAAVWCAGAIEEPPAQI